jgi:platelet-activating factor acetylhydrolase IB subunit alpha
MMTDGEKFGKSIAAFNEESCIDTSAVGGKGMLEKKWTAVIRLQKKVLELEVKVSSQGESVFNRPGGGKDDSRNIPKGPAKAALSGHRAPVTAVAIHPTYK